MFTGKQHRSYGKHLVIRLKTTVNTALELTELMLSESNSPHVHMTMCTLAIRAKLPHEDIQQDEISHSAQDYSLRLEERQVI